MGFNAGGGVFSKTASLPCLPTLVWGGCPKLRVPLLLFLFLKEIIPDVAVDLVCPWKGVSSESALRLHLELALLLLMAKLYSVLSIAYILCIHSAVDGR